jgi:hypothetical protein
MVSSRKHLSSIKKKIKRLYINSVEYTVEQDYVTVKMSLLTHEIYRR